MINNKKLWLLTMVAFLATSLTVFSFFYLVDYFASLSITSSDRDIKHSHAYLVSQDDSASISDIMTSDDFVNVVDKKISTTFGEQAYWHKYQVSNLSLNTRQLTLLFDNYVIAEIDLFVVESDTIIEKLYLGNARWQSHLELRALPSYSFELASNSKTTVYIRSQSKGSATLPFVLFHQDDYKNYKQYIYLLWGTFVGLIFIMAMYNMILYTGVKDVVYLYYIGYILSILIEMGLLHGFIIYLFPKATVNFLTNHISAVHYFIVFFGLLFALKYLKFDQDKGITYKIGKGAAVLLIPFAISTIWMKEYQAVQIYFVIQAIIYIFIFYLLVRKFRDNFSWAKYYFISWMPIYIGGAITPLFFVGTLEYSFWTRNALLVAVMIEAGLMAMALANRLRSNEERILFSITHDQVFGLANNALMSRVLNELKQNKQTNFNYTIIVAEIQQYHTFSPYLKHHQLKHLVNQVSSTIEDKLGHLPLVLLERRIPKSSYSFLVKDGIIGLAVNSDDPTFIQSELEKLNDVFPISFNFSTMSLSIRCVFGLAQSTDGKHPMQVASKALQVINTAKENSQISALYSATLVDAEQRKIFLVAELQKALEQDSLELYHQPQILMASQKPCGSEALVRWHHPKLGFISPDEFIPIAEDTGLIEQLTRWVVSHAYRHQFSLVEAGFKQTVSINISTLDVINNNLCHFIIESTRQYNIQPQNIILEVTETASILDQERFSFNLAKLSEAGFRIAIDDFGTGYSSLSYLSGYPIDELKIDKSLIFDLIHSKKNELIIKATLSMAKSLNLKVVAEGIEDQDVADKLRQFQCEIAQGYYFAKPMPFKDYLNWLQTP